MLTGGHNQVDQIWAYDDLDRLIENRRGTMNTSGSAWLMSNVTFLAGWALDTLGNTVGYMTVNDPTSGDVNLDGNVGFADFLILAQHYGQTTGTWTGGDLDGDGAVGFGDLLRYSQTSGFPDGNHQTTETRTYDGQNELLTMNTGTTTLAYDAAGNQTTDQSGHTTTSDAWNRPTAVKSGTTTLTSYVYDGLGRRIIEGPGGSTLHNYYDANWQLLEVRDTSDTTLEQNTWSPVYIDALIQRDRDADGTSADGMEERVYSQWDANFNVTSIIALDTDAATSGNQTGAIERYRYEAYGDRTVLDASSWAPDTLSGSDSTTTDDAAAGWNTSDYLFLNGHQGGMYDRTIAGAMRFRNRTLEVGQMRWEEVDPAGYRDSFDLYSGDRENPVNNVDPSGMFLPAPVAVVVSTPPGQVIAVGVVAIAVVSYGGYQLGTVLAGPASTNIHLPAPTYPIRIQFPDPDPLPPPLPPKPPCPPGPPPGCKPCIPPVGSVAQDFHPVPPRDPHWPWPGDHSHVSVMMQSPPSAGCKCFWHGVGDVPGNWGLPPIGPAGGGGIA